MRHLRKFLTLFVDHKYDVSSVILVYFCGINMRLCLGERLSVPDCGVGQGQHW